MRTFNYSAIREQKWDSEVLGLIAAIYKEAGKQELYLKAAARRNWKNWLRSQRCRALKHQMPLRAS